MYGKHWKYSGEQKDKNRYPHEASMLEEKTVMNTINARNGMFGEDMYFGEQ